MPDLRLTLSDEQGVVIDTWVVEEDIDQFWALMRSLHRSTPAHIAIAAVLDRDEEDE